MNIWVISDRHIGHAKLVDYEARPVNCDSLVSEER